MQETSVLITGGSGFIGSRLASALERDPLYKVTILDKGASPHENCITGDIADTATWEKMEPNDMVVHCAAFTSAVESEKEPTRSYQTNVEGTRQVAVYAKNVGAGVIFCSTIRVYHPDAISGQMAGLGKVNENCGLVEPHHTDQPPFAHHKRRAEDILLEADRSSGGVVIHRMSSIVGPGQPSRQGHGWVSYLVHCAKQGIPYTIFGDGDQLRDPIHVDDLVDLIQKELGSWNTFHRQGGSTYNVGGGPSMALSVNNVIGILKTRHDLELNIAHAEERKGEPRHYIADTAAIHACGWQPEHTDPYRLIEEMVNAR